MNKSSTVARFEPATLMLCFSHLRWDFVVQRPHHLMRRAAKSYHVVYWEEAVRHDGPESLVLRDDAFGVVVATPHIPHGHPDERRAVRDLLDSFVARTLHDRLITWYYTPMALGFSDHLVPDVCLYDCMDELSAFKFAPDSLGWNEGRLFDRSAAIFTGGRSLYEAKRNRHAHVHCLPSSIDAAHFHKARSPMPDPADQAHIPTPRVGFFGVIDERMDLDLVRQTAQQAPDLQFVIIGPVTKIDPHHLPQAANIHWLGSKRYEDLPAYLANWQAGWMPFALNDATRFISPTKTPEFLAAGLPLTSTAVPDVVADYAATGLVEIGDAASMAIALRQSLRGRNARWLAGVDEVLAQTSWDRTWAQMHACIEGVTAASTLRQDGDFANV